MTFCPAAKGQPAAMLRAIATDRRAVNQADLPEHGMVFGDVHADDISTDAWTDITAPSPCRHGSGPEIGDGPLLRDGSRPGRGQLRKFAAEHLEIVGGEWHRFSLVFPGSSRWPFRVRCVRRRDEKLAR
jgi:hypothetical protein